MGLLTLFMRRPAWDNRKGEEKDMKNTMEIRWHGRGGQGAKTAALLLADVAFKTGKYVQGFPEYGPERMGAPITAYNRISEEPITIHSNIYNPDYVVVVDDGLLASIDVTMGLGKEGAVIVNTQRSRKEIAQQLYAHGFRGSVYTVDAREISVSALGRYYPNTPMLAAAVAVSGAEDYEEAFALLAGVEDIALVICDSTDPEVQKEMKDSVIEASERRRERLCVAAGAKNEDVTALIARAKALNHERVVLVAPGAVSPAGDPISGLALAAAVAGAVAGESDPAIPLGGAELSGLNGLSAQLEDNDIDLLVLGGVTPLESVGGTVSVIRGVTTRTASGGTEDTASVFVGLGAERGAIEKGLDGYRGTERRFEVKGELSGVTVVDDYAHHPDEIRATLKTARRLHKKKLWCVFQPHTYTRTKAFLEEFASALSLADEIILADIYAAREKDTLGISSETLQEKIRSLGHSCHYFPTFEAIENYLLKNCTKDDLLITMGAGDVVKVGENLLQK